MNKETKVIVGMSGGVDSSVAAHLLIEAGYVVEGLFMKNWDEDDGTAYCTAQKDLEDAQSVCKLLGIKCHTASFAAEYWDEVFEHFLEEYRAGRTPNPDVLCNREIKFKAFLEHALQLGADCIATGHYVRKKVDARGTHLLKGSDPHKDQSYFLCEVETESLERSLFPVGKLKKTEVREIATHLKLDNHKKKDSTGICFIGERKFKDFLQQYIPAEPGLIATTEGKVIGEHSGLMYHTFGQRQGLGIGGIEGRPESPWYVVDKDLATNRLIVGQGKDHPRLYSKRLIAAKPKWISSTPLFPFECSAKIRYRQADQTCRVCALADGRIEVSFEAPQRAITPGQYIVFYDDALCLGAGIIENFCH